MSSSERKRKADAEEHPEADTPKYQRDTEQTSITLQPMFTREFKLSDGQHAVLRAALDGKSLFYTGSAGTGKSYLLRRMVATLREEHPDDTVFVAASTGIAAFHVGGTTLHSFAGIGLGLGSAKELAGRMFSTHRERWRSARVLVIDELSMVSAELFDKLEEVGRVVRKSTEPFGGLQVVLCGDFLQVGRPCMSPHSRSLGYSCPPWKASRASRPSAGAPSWGGTSSS